MFLKDKKSVVYIYSLKRYNYVKSTTFIRRLFKNLYITQ